MPVSIRKFFEGLGLVPKTSSTADTEGEFEYISGSTHKAQLHNGTSVSPLVTEAHSATLTNKSIDADNNTITNIDNNEIKAAAAIDASKIADGSVSSTEFQYINSLTSNAQTQIDGKLSNTLTSAHIYVGNGSNVATDVTVSGDLTLTNTGDFEIASGVIVNADINASAAIARTKIASGSANHVIINDGSGVLSSEAQLAVSRGGTGDSTLTAHGVLIGNGTSAVTVSSVGATGTVLHGNTGADPTFSAVSLTSDISGILPIANGGTNASSASSAFGNLSPLTTKGDVLGFSTVNARIPIGSNDQVLTADSTQTLGLKWATPAATITYTATAGETLATNDAVYICNTVFDAGRTVGQAYKLDPTNGRRTEYAGIVVTGVSSGASVTIQVVGEMSGFTGLSQGLPAYASITTPGSFQLTAPASTSATIILGWGSTATTKLLINAGLSSSETNVPIITTTIGYFVGGRNGAGNAVNSIQKLVFNGETTSTISATLAAVSQDSAGASYYSKGYIAGGFDGSTRVNTIRTLTFSGETTGTLSATISSSRQKMAGVQSSTDGYFTQGNTSGGDQSTVDKLTFSGETQSTVGNSSYTTNGSSGVSSSSAGYSCGGTNSGNTAALTSISKLTFGVDTSAANANSLASTRYNPFGVSSSTNGYLAGGYDQTGTYRNSIESLLFSADTVSTLSANITTGRFTGSTCSSSTRGYMAGGESNAIGANTVIQYILFSNESVASAANSLPTGIKQLCSSIQV